MKKVFIIFSILVGASIPLNSAEFAKKVLDPNLIISCIEPGIRLFYQIKFLISYKKNGRIPDIIFSSHDLDKNELEKVNEILRKYNLENLNINFKKAILKSTARGVYIPIINTIFLHSDLFINPNFDPNVNIRREEIILHEIRHAIIEGKYKTILRSSFFSLMSYLFFRKIQGKNINTKLCIMKIFIHLLYYYIYSIFQETDADLFALKKLKTNRENLIKLIQTFETDISDSIIGRIFHRIRSNYIFPHDAIRILKAKLRTT